MFCADLSDGNFWGALLRETVWKHSLGWLSTHAATSPLGDFQLGNAGWYVNVHTYDTRPEELCVWESHEATIDLQYVIEGTELIRWAPTRELIGPLKRYFDRDRLEWRAPNGDAESVKMTPGRFVVFMPGEGHCPMIALGGPAAIRKAVVKIPFRLLERLDCNLHF